MEVGSNINTLSEWEGWVGTMSELVKLNRKNKLFFFFLVKDAEHSRQESGVVFFLRGLAHCGKPPKFYLPW